MQHHEAFNRAIAELAPRKCLMTRQAYLQAVATRKAQLVEAPPTSARAKGARVRKRRHPLK